VIDSGKIVTLLIEGNLIETGTVQEFNDRFLSLVNSKNETVYIINPFQRILLIKIIGESKKITDIPVEDFKKRDDIRNKNLVALKKMAIEEERQELSRKLKSKEIKGQLVSYGLPNFSKT